MTEVTYTCSVCEQTFTDEATLGTHMITAHSTKTEVSTEGETK